MAHNRVNRLSRHRAAVRLIAVLVVGGLTGCSTQAVRCDGHLTPINVPGHTPADLASGAHSTRGVGMRNGGGSAHTLGNAEGPPPAAAQHDQARHPSAHSARQGSS